MQARAQKGVSAVIFSLTERSLTIDTAAERGGEGDISC
jgi:hypothetical protein